MSKKMNRKLVGSISKGDRYVEERLMQKNAKMQCKLSEPMRKSSRRKKSIIKVVYRQGHVFKRFKEKENFMKMTKNFGISKSIHVDF